MIRVLLVDDHPVVREGIESVLSADETMRVVGRAGSVESAVTLVRDLRPNVVLTDVRLPDGDGIDLCERLRVEHSKVKVLVLTRFTNETAMLRAFGAGAKAFLVKESDPEVLRHAVKIVAGGGTFVDPNVAAKLVAMATKGRRAKGPYGLSLQQMRVLELLPKGLSNREIGKEMGLSEETVKTHLRHAMQRIGASDRSEAASIAVREGLA